MSSLKSRQPQHNKVLHPIAYSPLVPRFLSAAVNLVVVWPRGLNRHTNHKKRSCYESNV
jgi:hypothetical protein